MADLRALLEELGYTDVRTVLRQRQRGDDRAEGAREKLERALAERFDMKIDVILRTMKELQAVVDADPFGDEVDEPDALLRRVPGPQAGRVKPLAAADDFAPDKFAANGRELYAWCPDGMQNAG